MRTLALYCLIVFPIATWANQNAKFWLDKMSAAAESLNYEGTFVFVHGDEVETMRIIHGSDDGGVKERIISLNGEAREIIRDEDALTCIWPRSNVVVVEKSRTRYGIPTMVPEQIEGLGKHYDLVVTGQSRIAGHDCNVVAIRPKDSYRYGYRLCIAQDTGMLLKSEMLDPMNRLIEQVVFTNIQFPSNIPEYRFHPSISGKGYVWHTAPSRKQVPTLHPDLAWHIGALPPGFKLSENVKRPIAASAQPVQHMVVTDGLATVSVFIAKSDAVNQVFNGTMGRGALHAHALTRNSHQITVVGEVPESTVEMIGQSIVYEESRHD
jgi:sigma-E factor negative regulatory protein RseB